MLTSASAVVGMHLAFVFNKFLKSGEKKAYENTQSNKWPKFRADLPSFSSGDSFATEFNVD